MKFQTMTVVSLQLSLTLASYGQQAAAVRASPSCSRFQEAVRRESARGKIPSRTGHHSKVWGWHLTCSFRCPSRIFDPARIPPLERAVLTLSDQRLLESNLEGL